jgi:chemotaxis protein methyltransferase CheR
MNSDIRNINTCRDLLQWALPRLQKRVQGYRKVRKQVCRRISQRMKELQIQDLQTYKMYLENNDDEWEVLDKMTFITISRFFRDRWQWEQLVCELLPEMLEKPVSDLRCWSAGCASGEEPYSMAIVWQEILQPVFKGASLEIVATDGQQHMLDRAKDACYSKESLKEDPFDYIGKAFVPVGKRYMLKPLYREMPQFLLHDIRHTLPVEGQFDLVFCKNIVAMYFEQQTAVEIFRTIIGKIKPGGLLLLGNHEAFPADELKMMEHVGNQIFRKM